MREKLYEVPPELIPKDDTVDDDVTPVALSAYIPEVYT